MTADGLRHLLRVFGAEKKVLQRRAVGSDGAQMMLFQKRLFRARLQQMLVEQQAASGNRLLPPGGEQCSVQKLKIRFAVFFHRVMQRSLKALHLHVVQSPGKAVVGHQATTLAAADGKQCQRVKRLIGHTRAAGAARLLQWLTNPQQQVSIGGGSAVALELAANKQKMQQQVGHAQHHTDRHLLEHHQQQRNGVDGRMGHKQDLNAAALYRQLVMELFRRVHDLLPQLLLGSAIKASSASRFSSR